MTYMMKPRPLPRARRSALGSSIWDQWSQMVSQAMPSQESVCLNEANAKVASLDAQTQDLARTWRPTGFYSPQQIDTIVAEGYRLGSRANDAVRAAPLSTSDAQTSKAIAVKDVQRKIAEGQKYVQAAAEARAKGIAVVSAPGLHAWMIGMMTATSQSLVTAAVLDCNMPWLASMIILFQGLFNIAASVVKKIVGVAVKVGETVLNVAGDLPQIWTVVKWGGLAAVGLAVAIKLGKMRRGS